MLLTHDAFGRLCRARKMLREVREQRLSIPEIARESGMSPFHFIRRFESLFGLTPHQFRIQARLDDAKLLLARGQHNVTEVCLEVGFESLGTFSDLFARRVGMTPSAYQRSARVVVSMPAGFPPVMFPGCLNLMGQLPASAFRNFQEA
jgi:AraC-like DNA-binding protein